MKRTWVLALDLDPQHRPLAAVLTWARPPAILNLFLCLSHADANTCLRGPLCDWGNSHHALQSRMPGP